MSRSLDAPMTYPVQHMMCFRVTVCASTLGTNFIIPKTADGTTLLNCQDSVTYVVTHDPVTIYEKFGREVVKSIERIGTGYHLPNGVP